METLDINAGLLDYVAAFNEMKAEVERLATEANKSRAKYLDAKKEGMTQWSEHLKGPYPPEMYEAVHANSVILKTFMEQASKEGYDTVKLERGGYPFLYQNSSGAVAPVLYKESHGTIDGVRQINLDCNDADFYAMFDSVNRSPYDINSKLDPYWLAGAMLPFRNTTEFTLSNVNMWGDEFVREWVDGEQNTEQTYGFHNGDNNVRFKAVNVKCRGFRGDGGSGNNRGQPFSGNSLRTWYRGGLDLKTGKNIEQSIGEYRTDRFDIRKVDIKRNMVTMTTLGYYQAAEFRNDLLDMFFYDTNERFISSQKFRQTDNVALPKGCGFIQVVAYDDERTTDTVNYGLHLEGKYLFLSTGVSIDSTIEHCVFEENHRGGLSNMPRGTRYLYNKFIDMGGAKQGNGVYWSTTLYGINQEDSFEDFAICIGNEFYNVPNAYLFDVRNLIIVGGIVQDAKYGVFGLGATVNASVNNVIADNCASLVSHHAIKDTDRQRVHKLSDLIVSRTNIYSDVSRQAGLMLDISGGTYTKCSVDLRGNYRNLVFDNNKFRSFYDTSTTTTMVILGALSARNNDGLHLKGGNKDTLRANAAFGLNGTNVGDNTITIEQDYQSRVTPLMLGGLPVRTSGTHYISNGKPLYAASSEPKADAKQAYVDSYYHCKEHYSGVQVFAGSTARRKTFDDAVIVYDRCLFDKGSHLCLIKLETVKGSHTEILVKKSEFDLTDAEYVVRGFENSLGTFNIRFIATEFYADKDTELDFLQGISERVTMTIDDNCTFDRVTNINKTMVM